MWGENPSGVRACRVAQAAPPHALHSKAGCASRRNNAARQRIGEDAAEPQTLPIPLPQNSLKCRKLGEGKLPASFPLAAGDSAGKLLRCVEVWVLFPLPLPISVCGAQPKSVGMRGPRQAAKLRRLRWFLPPQEPLKEGCFCCVEKLDLLCMLLGCTFSCPRGAKRGEIARMPRGKAQFTFVRKETI